MKENITKYKGATILNIPSEKYPEMVQVIKTSKKLNEFVGKKFINITKCMTTMDLVDTTRLIEKSRIKATKELSEWVVTED